LECVPHEVHFVQPAAGIALPAHAQQDYPNRLVNIVNPTQAGATTDVLARALVVGLSNRLGQQFVVVNRPGASGAIGTASVARAAPDGYTLLFGAVYASSMLPAARNNGISATSPTRSCRSARPSRTRCRPRSRRGLSVTSRPSVG
jgi:tripartite-type tricarboxylate transporter receptor subunit TctC